MIDVSVLRVLLVEDDQLDARMVAKRLGGDSRTAFKTVHVSDLASALSALGESEFDCVLLDLALPDSEGLASVQSLLNRAPDTPIVVLTGLDDPDAAVSALARGAQDYLSKQNLDTELVATAIRYAVTRHQSDQKLRAANELVHLLQERERIAADLHDKIISQLFTTGMSLQSTLSRTSDPDINRRLSTAVDEIDETIGGLRETIFGLHRVPVSLSLRDELARLIESEREVLGFAPLLHIEDVDDETIKAVRHDVLATVSEALTNVAKYASATACEIRLETQAQDVVLTIADNGVGFVEPRASEADHGLTGNGLHNMARRAKDLDGDFHIGPGDGGGTVLEWRARRASPE